MNPDQPRPDSELWSEPTDLQKKLAHEIQLGSQADSTDLTYDQALMIALPVSDFVVARDRRLELEHRISELHIADNNATPVLYKDDFKQGFAVSVSYIKDRMSMYQAALGSTERRPGDSEDHSDA